MTTKLIIFDLDGTLADCTQRLHHLQKEPADWDGFYDDCHRDSVIQAVRSVWWACKYFSYSNDEMKVRLEIWTGRDERVYPKTFAWLDANEFGVYDKIRMRPSGDHRPDYELKEQWLHEVGAENIAFVFEDRNQVVEMWRRNGVTCFQVADGKY